jgi:hypothetical protein
VSDALPIIRRQCVLPPHCTRCRPLVLTDVGSAVILDIAALSTSDRCCRPVLCRKALMRVDNASFVSAISVGVDCFCVVILNHALFDPHEAVCRPLPSTLACVLHIASSRCRPHALSSCACHPPHAWYSRRVGSSAVSYPCGVVSLRYPDRSVRQSFDISLSLARVSGPHVRVSIFRDGRTKFGVSVLVRQ